MPLQNRVDPYGLIFRTAARGSIMGNRGGVMHNDHRELVRPYKGIRWIACRLEFKGIRREVMAPRRYTELFFLDEAVSFAAGHRPCAECRRERFHAYRAAWNPALKAPEMDAELHRARIDRQGGKVTYQAMIDTLPNGCFIEWAGAPHLVWNDALFQWTPERYAAKAARPGGVSVTVLTPRPTVECFRRGYVPETEMAQ